MSEVGWEHGRERGRALIPDGTVRPLFVEFVGVPGSGKTTLAQALAELLTREGLAVSNPNGSWRRDNRIATAIRRFQLAMQCAVASPLSAFSGGRLVGISGQRSYRDARAVLMNWLCKRRLMQTAVPDAISISDEGLLHALWSLAYSATERATLGTLAATELVGRTREVSWMVVRVRTEQRTASEWLLARRGQPNRLAIDIETRGRHAAQDAMEAAHVVNSVIDLTLASEGGVAVIDIENRPQITPAEVVAPVAARLVDAIRRSSRGHADHAAES